MYILNRESTNSITISSPLEAHKPNTLCFDMVGIDVGYENPLFACLEVEYGDIDSPFSAVNTGEGRKVLTYYEMDLGLNHVIRKACVEVDITAHMLIQVPGDPDGPGGVILICENFLIYKKQDHEDKFCPIPRRNDMCNDKGLFIIAHSTHKQKDLFFFLIQSELGDLYRVTLIMNTDKDEVQNIQVQYFDTIKPSVDFDIMKSGFLALCTESPGSSQLEIF